MVMSALCHKRTYAVRQTPSWRGYHYGSGLGLLRSQPYDDIDTGDLVAFWRLRGLTNEQSTHGDVREKIDPAKYRRIIQFRA
jgi:hypothetical protein